jgi:hypothetical protein
MPEFNKDELMKLSPADRIKKLKELEEQRKKEVEEAEKLLKQAEIQMFEKALEEDKPPADLHQFAPRKLEDTINSEAIPNVPPESNVQYMNPFDNAVDLYHKIKVYNERDGPVTPDEAKTVGYLYDVFNEVVGNMAENEDKIDRISNKMKRMVKEIMGDYHANLKYDSE